VNGGRRIGSCEKRRFTDRKRNDLDNEGQTATIGGSRRLDRTYGERNNCGLAMFCARDPV
jgi:hypothetical protein